MKNNLIPILLSAVLLFGCKGNSTQDISGEDNKAENRVINLSRKALQETGITSIEAKYTSISGYIMAPAHIIPNQDQEAVVGSLVKGRVKRVFYNLGDKVAQGQALMELEGLEIGEIKSSYRKAKAALDFAESAYKRQKTLNEQNVSSSKTLLESKAEFDKAKAEFKAEDEKIHSIGLTDEETLNNSEEHSSGRLFVRAPINGIISERNVIIGQLVDENATAFKLLNISKVWADAQIYEKDIAKVSGKPSVTFTSAAYPNDYFTGNIIFTAQSVDEKTRTINIRAALNNSNNKLKPQMFGELRIPVMNSPKAIVVPSDAVINDNGKYYIYVQTGDTTFQKRDVHIGIKNDKNIEITDGLKENEKVVIKGVFYLKSESLKSSFGEED
jgi:cobalt-zinc-cadmium efflux system membrane fusion protein